MSRASVISGPSGEGGSQLTPMDPKDVGIRHGQYVPRKRSQGEGPCVRKVSKPPAHDSLFHQISSRKPKFKDKIIKMLRW